MGGAGGGCGEDGAPGWAAEGGEGGEGEGRDGQHDVRAGACGYGVGPRSSGPQPRGDEGRAQRGGRAGAARQRQPRRGCRPGREGSAGGSRGRAPLLRVPSRETPAKGAIGRAQWAGHREPLTTAVLRAFLARKSCGAAMGLQRDWNMDCPHGRAPSRRPGRGRWGSRRGQATGLGSTPGTPGRRRRTARAPPRIAHVQCGLGGRRPREGAARRRPELRQYGTCHAHRGSWTAASRECPRVAWVQQPSWQHLQRPHSVDCGTGRGRRAGSLRHVPPIMGTATRGAAGTAQRVCLFNSETHFQYPPPAERSFRAVIASTPVLKGRFQRGERPLRTTVAAQFESIACSRAACQRWQRALPCWEPRLNTCTSEQSSGCAQAFPCAIGLQRLGCLNQQRIASQPRRFRICFVRCGFTAPA